MQKAIRPLEPSWTKTNNIFITKNEEKPSSSSLSWLTSSTSTSSKPSSLSWLTSSTSSKPSSSSLSTKTTTSNMVVMENAVVVFAKRGCCMGHVAKRLLLTHGVNPLVVEIDDEGDQEQESMMMMMISKEKLPVMFIGGKMFGGLENLMAAHINGDLEPILRQAGALWL